MARTNDFINNANKVLGAKIRRTRIAKGMTRTKLAEQIEVSHQQLQKYEKGSNRISAIRLLLIANALKIDILEFYEGLHEDYTPEITQSSRMAMQVSNNFLLIENPKEQYAVNQLVRTLAAN